MANRRGNAARGEMKYPDRKHGDKRARVEKVVEKDCRIVRFDPVAWVVDEEVVVDPDGEICDGQSERSHDQGDDSSVQCLARVR